MAVEIYQLHPDEKGHIIVSGLFDGEPFRLLADKATWMLRFAQGQAVAVPAEDVSSRADARMSIYAAVAHLRARQKIQASA